MTIQLSELIRHVAYWALAMGPHSVGRFRGGPDVRNAFVAFAT
jgi:hypothetical protein